MRLVAALLVDTSVIESTTGHRDCLLQTTDQQIGLGRPEEGRDTYTHRPAHGRQPHRLL